MRAPCGCAKSAEAQETPDEEERKILLNDAREAALAWQCPRVCSGAKALDADHAEALDAIASLTGHRFKTCPYAGAYAPWAHRVVDADEHGLGDDAIAYGPPSRTLIQAVRVVRMAKRKRDIEERKVSQRRKDE